MTSASDSFTYFISDLHLSEDRMDITDCFEHFMQKQAPQADALYILGDLFEIWIGDDNITEFSERIADIILTLSQSTPVYFIHGNRDFAIGKRYAKRSGMKLLPEQMVVDLYGQQTLILHGDELCTRDIEYMKFRKKARGWWWPRLMLLLPLSYRKKIADKGRQTSINNQKRLSTDIMDVTQSEVVETLKRHKVTSMIHGHTHRPDVHSFVIESQSAKRIVLGDWYDQGSILYVDKNGTKLFNQSL